MNKLQIFTAATLLGSAQFAMALPSVTISDTYRGSDDHGHGDVIGSDNKFDIHSMDVQLNGNMLSVSINTNFAGRNDDGEFSSYTNSGNGIGYGDLFLSSAWNPVGAAPYSTDDNTNGTKWTYGFSLGSGTGDRWDTSGTGNLYALNTAESNDHNALLSEDFLNGATFRDGQEVAVDTSASGVSVASTGSWNTTLTPGESYRGKVNFLIDLTGTDLLGGDIALHWGMTCANDTIEGKYAVPAPSLLALFGMGLPLIGLAAVARRKS